ncbi:MAG: hypothetical protein LBM41_07470 [Ruminococcus sp.]|nr:hypothetical protein [Ruminococcus sp.]
MKVPWNTDDEDLIKAALKNAGLKKGDIKSAHIYKISVDARKRDHKCDSIKKVASVVVDFHDKGIEENLISKGFKSFGEGSYIPSLPRNKRAIIIAGFGPAGMFAGLVLSENGYNPIILERGGEMSDRVTAVKSFWEDGILNPESNVQFGEGGAGTFSDGKLTTRINDSRVRYIIETLVKYGAPSEILRFAKPHIGTDRLREVVINIRKAIIKNGGEVRFNSKLTGVKTELRRIKSVVVNDEYELPCDALIAAIGHSAHDTVKMLMQAGADIEGKPFSVGVRIEHNQEALNAALYGENRGRYKNLPVGEYQLSRHFENHTVYSFCMCPGGVVVPSSSDCETIVTNGMSFYARDGENANSAVCVSVSPEDFGNNPLDGMEFIKRIEAAAYNPKKPYSAPGTSVLGFLSGKASLSSLSVNPTYSRGLYESDFTGIFPEFIIENLKSGIKAFSRQLSVFGDGGAVLTAPETRTSSPVRVLRTEELHANGITNLFPCGEGAGYAGGIVSAAVDGLKCAEGATKIGRAGGRLAPQKIF